MELRVADFADSFGVSEKDLSSNLILKINRTNTKLISLSQKERDNLIIEIIDRIRKDKQIIASENRTADWERGWQENLDMFRNNPESDEALVPKFVRAGKPIRWFQEYYFPEESKFELKYIDILREHVIESYFKGVENLYEFGAGTGFNLLHANKIFPNLKLFGTDFVESAVALMNEVGKTRKIPLTASTFNMLLPYTQSYNILENSAAWTFGSLEQLGGNIEEMFEYLLSSNFEICVHIEPVAEFYELDNLPDYLASWFQNKRGYTSGLVPLLKSLEKEKRIELIKCRRLHFGSMMMEGYNLLVWKPLR